MTDRVLGFSGRIARYFLGSPLTPILAIAALLLGVIASLTTPREEEPQIDVTIANVDIPYPGAGVSEVEKLIAFPMEQVLAEIEGVKHIYSASRPGAATITVEFEVGVPRRDAIVRLYNQIYSHADRLPSNLGAGPALVRPMSIDDVPVMTLTLWADDDASAGANLTEVAHALETDLKRIPGTRDIYSVGANERAVLVELDAPRLAAYDLASDDLVKALQAANVVAQAGSRVDGDRDIPTTAGAMLADAAEVAHLVIGLKNGTPIYLSDVANIRNGSDLPEHYTWTSTPPGKGGPKSGIAPSVTLAVAKKPGTSASEVTHAIRQRIDALSAIIIPQGVHVDVTRDYGDTANDKAQKLIEKLVLATGSVVLLVLAMLGWREALVVGVAVIITLAMTLFASQSMGFTINRVSLFALIFSIGILVDDAIVIVENIHRHLAHGDRTLREAIPQAVAEVGGPTILATFTVIAALLPIAFVSGLTGPYMRPIPINASAGMLISLAVALIVTPWLALKMLRHQGSVSPARARSGDALTRLFGRIMRPFLGGDVGRRRRHLLFAALGALVLVAAGLALVKVVILKMLPFDNKSEFQIVLDMPEGTTLETTNRALLELAQIVETVPEVTSIQGYAGTSAPINFNGLVRQYYLRRGPNVGDLQVNLLDRHLRERQSHTIASAVRQQLTDIERRYNASIKVVEVPPGPPVLAPIVAEIYGPDYERAQQIGNALAGLFRATADVVDVDTSVEAESARQVITVDRDRAARLGLDQASIVSALRTALGGTDAAYLSDGRSKYPVPIRLHLAPGEQAHTAALLALRVRSRFGQLVPLSEVSQVHSAPWEKAIFHKDLMPVVYVTGNAAGRVDSPLYGMFAMFSDIAHEDSRVPALNQLLVDRADGTSDFTIKWEGEWRVTYETFRDMGVAYLLGLSLIYLLLVGQFRSYSVPLIIMAPIPLTMIGVMPGHAALGAQFTATSMIGMIALAGIIVRNSILLIDFINRAHAAGQSLEDAVISAGAVRAKPIALTALAAVLGASYLLDDPIFNGLAVALIFGILVSTLLTLVVIPLLYYGWLAPRETGPQAVHDRTVVAQPPW